MELRAAVGLIEARLVIIMFTAGSISITPPPPPILKPSIVMTITTAGTGAGVSLESPVPAPWLRWGD